MKMTTKPTSVRLDNKLLEELDQRCRKVGCSRNDFIKNSVELVMNNGSDFDFGDEEDIEDNEQSLKIKPRIPITGVKIMDTETGQEWMQDKDGSYVLIVKGKPKAKITLH